MQQTSNEILKNILGVLGQINSKLDKQSKQKEEKSSKSTRAATAGASTSGLLNDFTENDKSKISALKDLSTTLKDLSSGIIEIQKLSKKESIGKILSNIFNALDEKKIESTSSGLKLFFQTIIDFGNSKSSIDRAINLFNSLSESMKGINETTKSLTNLFLSVGLSIVLIAGGLALSGKLLGTSPLGALGIIALSILVIGGIMIGLTMLSKFIKPGQEAVKGIGQSLLILSLGLLGFIVSMELISSILGAGSSAKGLLISLGIIAMIVAGTVGLFALIGLAAPLIQRGTAVIQGMAIGMLLLAGGIVALALVGKIISNIAGAGNTKEENSGIFGQYGPMIKGLGVMGLILLGSIAFFSLVGLAAPLIIPGVFASIGMALSLILLSVAVKKLVETSKALEGKDVHGIIVKLTGDVISGIIDGVGGALTGGKTGLKGLGNALKNTAILFDAIVILMGLSLSLSMFAKAISAFVDLGNMRVISGYKSNGEPIFGQTVNIQGVGQTIVATLTNFLTNLLDSTEDLTKTKAKAIKKMGRALTGKRGILSAVIQFADALKVYAQFGEKGQIGYLTYEGEGENQKEVTKYVAIKKVTKNMVDSFIFFVSELTKNTEDAFDLSGRERRKIKKMAKLLTGEDGVLSAVIQFSDSLQVYAKYGEQNMIPIGFDEKGKPTGFISMQKVAANIVNSLSVFATEISKAVDSKNIDVKSAKKALEKFEDLIEAFADLAKAQSGLEKVGSTIGMLAANIGLLSTNLKDIDTSKLSQVSEIGNKRLQVNIKGEDEYLKKTATKISTPNVRNTNIYNTTTNTTNTPQQQQTITQQKIEQPDWNKIAMMIGAQVAASIRNGSFKFEFANSNEGVLTIK